MRIIVTGSNGLLGQNLCQLISSTTSHQCIGFSQGINQTPNLSGYENMDISNLAQLSYCIERHQPDVIIHTAAISKPDVCEQNPELCWRVNVEATQNIAQICKKLNIHLIHLSTDFIFDGLAPLYTEESKPQPLSLYGRSKAECENILNEELENCAIIRTSLVYGTVQNNSRSNLVLWVRKSLQQGKAIRVCNDQFRTPTWVGDLAQACLSIAEHKLCGTFNIAGPELYSVYEIAQATARCFGLDGNLIHAVATIELNEPARRPVKTYLDCRKANIAFGFEPKTLHKGLSLLKNCCMDC